MRRRGFVFIEILAVVTILAVLGIIAIPAFAKAKYKAEKNQAISYLRVIRTAEKLYWSRGDSTGTKTYLALADKAAINTQLGIEIQLTNYTFAVTAAATTFTATATDTISTKTITLDQAGTWGGTYTPLPSV